MEERYLIKPDAGFIKELKSSGGESFKKCFQCGNCTVVCSLSPSENPYPRKEMLWAQWGLKDRLISDPDIWLCHHCADCSTHCPRGAKPGDVLGIIRSKAIAHYAVPAFMGKALSSSSYLPLLIIIPALLLFAFLWLVGDFNFPQGEIVFRNLIPIEHGYIGMGAITAFLVSVVYLQGRRFWRDINKFHLPYPPENSINKGFFSSFLSALIDILKHSDFLKCGTSKVAYFAHMGIFYGFVLLLLSAFFGAVYHLVGIESPYPQIGAVKIAGHLGTALLLGGTVLALYRRYFQKEITGKSTYFDWFLVWLLLFVVLTGIAMEVLRLVGLAISAYWTYFTHLWVLFMLLVYSPFSKGAHLLYRTLAMTYTRWAGRKSPVAGEF